MRKILEGRSPLLLIVLFFFTHCQTQNAVKCPETRSTDSVEITLSKIGKLPAPLREISGMIGDGHGLIWSINDEEGKIYVIDTTGSSILSMFSFGVAADYEAITANKDTVHVMRSDAVICSFSRTDSVNVHCKPITGLPLMCETESLAVREEQLFTICKGALSTSRFQVFRLDLYDGYWKASSYADWSPCLNKFKDDHSGRSRDIHPSDLYYDHQAKHWVMLSTKPSYILVMDDKGDIKASKWLDPDDWPQPEAICGGERVGEYWFSSEGSKKGKLGKVVLR